MGFVFVFVGWKGSATKAFDRNHPIVKGFLYGLVGVLATLMTDWKALFGSSVDKTRLVTFYGIPYVIVGFGGVLAIGFGIWIKFVWLRRDKPEDVPSRPFDLALDYFTGGYGYHKKEYERLLDLQRQDRLTGFRRLAASGANKLAALIHAATEYQKHPTNEVRKLLIQQVLQLICLMVEAHTQDAPQSDLNASLMIAVPFTAATEPQKKSLKFTWGDMTRYGHILVLCEYAYERGQEHFSLPVEDPDRNRDWENWILLGAPEAFLRKKELVVRTKKLDFAREVPKNIQGDIEQHFKGKGYQSFGCLIVPKEGSLIGVVNVESQRDHIFLGSDEIQNEIAQALQPFCAVLSLILQTEIEP